MLEIILVSSIIIFITYLVLVKIPQRRRLLEKLEDFTGPPSLPILGNALDLNVDRRDVLKVFGKWIDDYGRRVKVFIGPQPYLMLANASDVEKILTSPTQIEKSDDYRLFQPWLGMSLIIGGGELWSRRRKQLTPAFHFKILEDFLRIFNEQCAILKRILEGKGNRKFDVFPVLTHCALDIICESAMGRKINAQEQSDSEYVKAVYRTSGLIQYRILRPWFHPDVIWNLTPAGKEQERCLKILHGFTDSVIAERKRDRQGVKKETVADEFSKKRLAFLDLLLEAQETDPTLTDRNLREETDTFMFAGHDTTGAGVSWAVFLLAAHPEIQAKVHQEMDRIFGDDRVRDVTMSDLAEMKYLECCIKEALRIYPSAPFIGRKLTKDLALEDGSVIPVGCLVWILIYFLHRDEAVFPDPEKFDPDRFLLKECQKRHPFSYAPFSAGPRNCIGQKFAMMEEKVMLATFFRSFKVKAEEKREDISVLSELVTRPENGLHISVEKR